MKGPLILLGVIAGVAVLAVVMAGPGPSDDRTAAPAADAVRARYAKLGRTEGKDFTIEPPAIVSRDDDSLVARVQVKGFEIRTFYFELRRERGKWAVAADLDESFDAFLKTEDPRIQNRLGERLVERFRAEVQFRVTGAKILLRDREGKVYGTVDWTYQERGGPGRYLEEFAYEKGAWTLNGGGQLFDMGRP